MAFDAYSGFHEIKIVGNPFRGLARAGTIELDGASPPGSITEPVTQPVKGATEMIQPSPAPPAVVRTPEQALDDTSKGYTWENFSLLSGETKVLYGIEIGRNSSIYIDGNGRRWLFDWELETTATPIGGTDFNLTGTLVSEFGVLDTRPSGQPPAAAVNVEKLNEDYPRDAEEDTYIFSFPTFPLPDNKQMTILPSTHFPVQQSPDGSKVMCTWRTGEDPPDFLWGNNEAGGFGSGNELVAYIVEVTISGDATDDAGTGITATGSLIKSWEITFTGDRFPSGGLLSFPQQKDAGEDGTSTTNTMRLHRIRTTADAVTCVDCDPICPSGSATLTGTHSQTFSNIPQTGQQGGLRYWNGEHIYEKKYRGIVSAYYDTAGLAHFIEIENRVWQRLEYSFDYTQTLSESISHTQSRVCVPVGPITLSGAYTFSSSTSADCLRERSLNQSVEVFIDGASEDFHSIENILREKQVVSYSESDSASAGDVDFDTFSPGCLTGPGGPCSVTDNWYTTMGGSNFTRSGTKTTVNEIELKVDGAPVCFEDGLPGTITPIDEFSPVGTLIPCFLLSDECSNLLGGGCVGGTPLVAFGCRAFPDSGFGCTPDVGGSVNGCEQPNTPCEGTLPRGVIVAPNSRDIRTGWYLHSNRSVGYRYDLRHTGCDPTVGNFTDKFLRAVADGHLDTRQTDDKEIRSTVHPVDDRFEVSEDDNIAWV